MHSKLSLTQNITEDVVFILSYEHKIQFETSIYKPKYQLSHPHAFHVFTCTLSFCGNEDISITVIQKYKQSDNQ